MNKPKAILFDFDGTLVDSIDILIEIFAECLLDEGIKPPDYAEIRSLIGKPLDEIFQILTNYVDVEKFNKNFHTKENALHNKECISLVKNSIPTLDLFKKQGLQMGIVSTKPRDLVESLSHELEIMKFFEFAIGGCDVDFHKPHPQPIFLACEKLQIQPSEALFVGDSLMDCHAAKNAGSVFVGVLTGVATKEDFENNNADYVFNHIGEIGNLTHKLLEN